MHEAVLRRGVRADEAAPGSGLGLQLNFPGQWLIALGRSRSGLRARLQLELGRTAPSGPRDRRGRPFGLGN